jgi:hypothetical protein
MQIIGGLERRRKWGGLVTMLRHCWPLDGELAVGSHWVVKIACVVGFGVPPSETYYPPALTHRGAGDLVHLTGIAKLLPII